MKCISKGKMKALSAVLMTALVLGCAFRQPVLTQKPKVEIGRFAVVAVSFPPTLTMDITRSGGHGAAKGAGAGAAGGALLPIQAGLESGDGLGLVVGILLAPFFATGGAIYGAIHGAISADPSKQVQHETDVVQGVVLTTKFQQNLKQDVLDYISKCTSYVPEEIDVEGATSRSNPLDYRELKDIDTVLEIGILDIKFRELGLANQGVYFRLQGLARLVSVHDGKILFELEYSFQSPGQELAQWGRSGGAEAKNELERGLRQMAEAMVDDLLLVSTDFSFESGTKFCGLQPYYPQARYSFWSGGLKFIKVDSVQPTFRWEPFPRNIDKESAMVESLGRISEVRFDLKVLKVKEDLSVALIYSRYGLTDVSHKIEQQLEPATRYFWTVRARFKSDGISHATKWSYSRLALGGSLAHDPCNLYCIPVQNYYRFVTPRE